ncbi:MerR family transcriptional regulator [Bradymonas sediminis]|uniref:Uncharacterized protein n=1 Tax=Bradymonas sediminis TaxID=1548548 RepID=A0A2Z4FI18_9DELT|nr:MerR family transcriptional regulator [Bradymonas sediminis]AWV88336.1 hypothetical protein DN745_02850 [Bradymonas sediminis]TDP77461.1 DNA-binding transcriptional MerR regulator [Bradymonas sediminis]
MEIEALDIPEKTFFKIGEVAKLLDLEPYVLRYWESEFEMLQPDKTDSGQRSYKREDIELICQIRGLLYDEMFTIAGARRQLELEGEGKPNLISLDTASEASQQPQPQTDLWEQRNETQAQRIEELEAEIAELQQKASLAAELDAALEAQVAHTHEQAAEIDTLMGQLAEFAAQDAQIEALEAELAQANQTIANLQARPAQSTPGALDPAILDSLRRQVQHLASLAQRPD